MLFETMHPLAYKVLGLIHAFPVDDSRRDDIRALAAEIDCALATGAAAIGSRGGRAGKGKAKARSTEQARKAAKARWQKAKA